jgi:hypothetical protein
MNTYGNETKWSREASVNVAFKFYARHESDECHQEMIAETKTRRFSTEGT